LLKKYTELSKTEEDRAQEIHKKTLCINALVGFATSDRGDIITNFQRFCDTMREGGVSAVNLTIASNQNIGETCSIIAHMYNLIERVDDSMLIKTVEDIREAKQYEKAGIIFGFQNTETLERKAGAMELYYNLGVRIIQLTYSEKTRAGDGCYERTDCGVSRYGIDLIKEMNRRGILIDLSHCGPKTTLEAIDFSKDPVAFTHSGAKGVNNFARIKGDEEIKALAEKGGVIGIIAESNFIKHEGGKKLKRATLEDMLDHVDYIRDLVGIETVCIGGDIPEVRDEIALNRYNILRRNALKIAPEEPDPVINPLIWYHRNTYPETMWVKGFDTMAETINITRGLVARGYSDLEIMGVLGGNFLNLLDKVWKK
jgi:membrane dipeptidase